MKYIRNILFVLVIGFFIQASPVFAGPGVVWSDEVDIEETPGGFTFTGHLEVVGIDQTQPPLTLLVFVDATGDDFEPPSSYANLGPAENGEISFPYAGGTPNTYFLPVLIDTNSFNGSFPPYSVNQSQFQVYVVGQVANATYNGDPVDPTDPDPTDPNPTDPNLTDPCPPLTPPEDCPIVPAGGGQTGGLNSWPQNLIDNPLEVDNLNSFIIGLLNALLKIGIPIMVIFLVYSGLRLVMARGNEKELEDAKKNLLWVIIGIAILLCAWTIVKILKGTLDQIDITLINNLVDHFV